MKEIFCKKKKKGAQINGFKKFKTMVPGVRLQEFAGNDYETMCRNFLR